MKVGGSVYAGIGILDPHIAQSDDGFKAPLEMTSHPECNTRLDAKVKILEFLQPITCDKIVVEAKLPDDMQSFL